MWNDARLTEDVSKIPMTWEARRWDTAMSQEMAIYSAGSTANPLIGRSLSGDGQRVFSWSSDGTVTLRDAASGEQKGSFKARPSNGRILALSMDGQRMASTSMDGSVRLWDTATGQEILTLGSFSWKFLSAAYSGNGKRIVLGNGEVLLKLFDAETGRAVLALKGPKGIVSGGVALSPDGQRIASMGSDRIVRIWDVATAQQKFALAHSTVHLPLRAYISCLVFSPTGKHLVSTSDDNLLKLWDAKTGREVLTFKGHTQVVRGVAFSPDGQRVVSAADDRTLRVWDVATGQEMLTFQLSGSTISVAFSKDGERIVSKGHDGTVRVWDAPFVKPVSHTPA
jgi:WD40 repeat protein